VGRIFGIESGALSASGLVELGLGSARAGDRARRDVDAALRTTGRRAGLRNALGAVVLEVWGQARQLDLVATVN